jgi:hypothetical protein
VKHNYSGWRPDLGSAVLAVARAVFETEFAAVVTAQKLAKTDADPRTAFLNQTRHLPRLSALRPRRC